MRRFALFGLVAVSALCVRAAGGIFDWPAGRTVYAAPEGKGSGDSWSDPASLTDAFSKINEMTGTADAPIYLALEEGTYYTADMTPMSENALFVVNDRPHLIIRSRFCNPGKTVIQGDNFYNPNVRCIAFERTDSHTNDNAVIGLTIKGFASGASGVALCGGGADGGYTVSNCVFRGNTGLGSVASAIAGGAVVFGFGTVVDCVFDSNSSALGASVLCVHDFIDATNGADRVTACVVSGCTFSGSSIGPALSGVYAPDCTVTNCLFTGNSHGCVYSGTSFTPAVCDCDFRDNTTEGKAIVRGGGRASKYRNCRFVGNVNDMREMDVSDIMERDDDKPKSADPYIIFESDVYDSLVATNAVLYPKMSYADCLEKQKYHPFCIVKESDIHGTELCGHTGNQFLLSAVRTIEDCRFIDNKLDLPICHERRLTEEFGPFVRCVFIGNSNSSVNDYGFGPILGTRDSYTHLKLVNCLVARNSCRGNALLQGVIEIVNCTIVDNDAAIAVSGEPGFYNATPTYWSFYGTVLVNSIVHGSNCDILFSQYRQEYLYAQYHYVCTSNCVYASGMGSPWRCQNAWNVEEWQMKYWEPDEAHPWGYEPKKRDPHVFEGGDLSLTDFGPSDVDLSGGPRLRPRTGTQELALDLGCYELIPRGLPSLLMFVR